MGAVIYAVYHGDEYLGQGTSYQLARRFNVKPSTVEWWASPANHRKCEQAKRPRMVAERIGNGAAYGDQ